MKYMDLNCEENEGSEDFSFASHNTKKLYKQLLSSLLDKGMDTYYKYERNQNLTIAL